MFLTLHQSTLERIRSPHLRPHGRVAPDPGRPQAASENVKVAFPAASRKATALPATARRQVNSLARQYS